MCVTNLNDNYFLDIKFTSLMFEQDNFCEMFSDFCFFRYSFSQVANNFKVKFWGSMWQYIWWHCICDCSKVSYQRVSPWMKHCDSKWMEYTDENDVGTKFSRFIWDLHFSFNCSLVGNLEIYLFHNYQLCRIKCFITMHNRFSLIWVNLILCIVLDKKSIQALYTVQIYSSCLFDLT